VATSDNNTVIAYALARILVDEMELLRIATVRTHMRQGWGQTLLLHLIEDAKQSGMCRLLLEVAESNHPARQLYGKAGFETQGRRPHYYPDGDDALLMALQL